MSFKLIILVVIVLGILAIAQLVRVYELSSKLRDRREEDITNRDNRLNANLLLLFMILSYIGFGYLLYKYGWTGRGVAASKEGVQTDWLLDLNFVIISIAFLISNTLLFYFSYKYVRKPGVKAFWYPHNNKLEMLWTVVPAIILAVIIILGLKVWNEQTSESSKEAIKIELFSEQFAWTARYAGVDNKLGRFDYKLTTAENPLALVTSESLDSAIFNMEFGKADGSVLGIKMLQDKLNNPANIFLPKVRTRMENDLNRYSRLLRLLVQMKARHNKNDDAMAYNDIIQSDTLFLKVNHEFELTFRAKDVIHSAYFPHFRTQMNTVPGLVTRMKFTPTITTAEMRKNKNDENFNFILMCNKICGGSHYKMKMLVVVLEPKAYDEMMAKKASYKTFKNIFLPVKPAATPAVADGAAADSVKVDSAAVAIR